MSLPTSHSRAEPGDRCLQWRTGMLCFGMISVFSLLAWRLIHLQVEEHSRFLAVLEKSQHDTQILNASRGDILDTRGRVLACDEPVQQVAFNLGFLQKGSPLADALAACEGMKASDLRHAFSLEELQNRYLSHVARLAAPALGITEPEFQAKIRPRLTAGSHGEVVLTRDLSVSAALKLRENLETAKLGSFKENRGTLGALIFQNSFARRYPADLPLTHIVGFFGETKPGPGGEAKPARGVAGVERFFEPDLAGTPGMRDLEVDGWGTEIPAYRGSVTPPRHGRGLRLSLDLGLQGVVEHALDETGDGVHDVYLEDLKAERVIVVLFDPTTMGVRAIGCRDLKYGPGRPMLSNPATELLYEPGSTIKIVTLAGAISSGKVSSQSQIDLGSGGSYDDSDIVTINDDHAYSSLTVEDILVHSSNIGAYKLGRMLGTRRFEEVFRDFGFCRKTGFESPSESRGNFATQKMTMQTLSRVSYGMAIQVTPAQMCGALGAIINDGMHQPMHIAESWVDEAGQAVEGMPRQEARRVITSAAAKAVRQAMVQVVERGTGKAGRSELFEIAGKTGTAWKAVTITDKNGKKRTVYGDDRICSFIGFLPADKPRLGGLVIIDTPRGTKHAQYGGKMAAPLFRRIAERAMAYYEVPAQFFPDVRLLPQAASTTTTAKGNSRSFTR